MEPYPLRFRPILKQTIWGGRRLGDTLGKPIGDRDDYAESWEVVDHGKDQSVVENGPLAGRSLRLLMLDHKTWLMGEHASERQFPLLFKYLDCNDILSVQVHPNDKYAGNMPVPDRGKTEAWYVVSSQPESVIFAGLQPGTRREDLEEAVGQGDLNDVLHSFHPEAGDCVFIPAGTVHALGKGLLIAEIQQASDTTFRLFDWNRVDKDGNSRKLHVEQSLNVTNFRVGPVEPSKSKRDGRGWQSLVLCDKFSLQSLENGSAEIGGDRKFHILSVPRGTATIAYGDETLSLSTGDSVLLPAAMKQVKVELGEQSTVLEMQAK